MRRRHRGPRDGRVHHDRGAALIMAIGFMVAVGGLCAGLSALVTSSLRNRAPLEAMRNRQFSADGAVQYAISQIRSDTRSPLLACSADGATFTPNGLPTGMPVLNGIAIRVDWDNACGSVRGSDGVVVVQRNVIFSACLASASVCRQTDAVIVRAQVNFEQDPSEPVSRTVIQTWSVNG